MLLEGLETLSLLQVKRTMAKVASSPLYQPIGDKQADCPAGAAPWQEADRAGGAPDPPHPQAKELLERVAPSLAEIEGSAGR